MFISLVFSPISQATFNVLNPDKTHGGMYPFLGDGDIINSCLQLLPSSDILVSVPADVEFIWFDNVHYLDGHDIRVPDVYRSSDFLILPVENGCVAVRISSYLFRSSLDSFLSQISGVLKINTSFSSAFGDIDDKLSSFLASMTQKNDLLYSRILSTFQYQVPRSLPAQISPLVGGSFKIDDVVDVVDLGDKASKIVGAFDLRVSMSENMPIYLLSSYDGRYSFAHR